MRRADAPPLRFPSPPSSSLSEEEVPKKTVFSSPSSSIDLLHFHHLRQHQHASSVPLPDVLPSPPSPPPFPPPPPPPPPPLPVSLPHSSASSSSSLFKQETCKTSSVDEDFHLHDRHAGSFKHFECLNRLRLRQHGLQSTSDHGSCLPQLRPRLPSHLPSPHAPPPSSHAPLSSSSSPTSSAYQGGDSSTYRVVAGPSSATTTSAFQTSYPQTSSFHSATRPSDGGSCVHQPEEVSYEPRHFLLAPPPPPPSPPRSLSRNTLNNEDHTKPPHHDHTPPLPPPHYSYFYSYPRHSPQQSSKILKFSSDYRNHHRHNQPPAPHPRDRLYLPRPSISSGILSSDCKAPSGRSHEDPLPLPPRPAPHSTYPAAPPGTLSRRHHHHHHHHQPPPPLSLPPPPPPPRLQQHLFHKPGKTLATLSRPVKKEEHSGAKESSFSSSPPTSSSSSSSSFLVEEERGVPSSSSFLREREESSSSSSDTCAGGLGSYTGTRGSQPDRVMTRQPEKRGEREGGQTQDEGEEEEGSRSTRRRGAYTRSTNHENERNSEQRPHTHEGKNGESWATRDKRKARRQTRTSEWIVKGSEQAEENSDKKRVTDVQGKTPRQPVYLEKTSSSHVCPIPIAMHHNGSICSSSLPSFSSSLFSSSSSSCSPSSSSTSSASSSLLPPPLPPPSSHAISFSSSCSSSSSLPLSSGSGTSGGRTSPPLPPRLPLPSMSITSRKTYPPAGYPIFSRATASAEAMGPPSLGAAEGGRSRQHFQVPPLAQSLSSSSSAQVLGSSSFSFPLDAPAHSYPFPFRPSSSSSSPPPLLRVMKDPSSFSSASSSSSSDALVSFSQSSTDVGLSSVIPQNDEEGVNRESYLAPSSRSLFSSHPSLAKPGREDGADPSVCYHQEGISQARRVAPRRYCSSSESSQAPVYSSRDMPLSSSAASSLTGLRAETTTPFFYHYRSCPDLHTPPPSSSSSSLDFAYPPRSTQHRQMMPEQGTMTTSSNSSSSFSSSSSSSALPLPSSPLPSWWGNPVSHSYPSSSMMIMMMTGHDTRHASHNAEPPPPSQGQFLPGGLWIPPPPSSSSSSSSASLPLRFSTTTTAAPSSSSSSSSFYPSAMTMMTMMHPYSLVVEQKPSFVEHGTGSRGEDVQGWGGDVRGADCYDAFFSARALTGGEEFAGNRGGAVDGTHGGPFFREREGRGGGGEEEEEGEQKNAMVGRLFYGGGQGGREEGGLGVGKRNGGYRLQLLEQLLRQNMITGGGPGEEKKEKGEEDRETRRQGSSSGGRTHGAGARDDEEAHEEARGGPLSRKEEEERRWGGEAGTSYHHSDTDAHGRWRNKDGSRFPGEGAHVEGGGEVSRDSERFGEESRCGGNNSGSFQCDQNVSSGVCTPHQEISVIGRTAPPCAGGRLFFLSSASSSSSSSSLSPSAPLRDGNVSTTNAYVVAADVSLSSSSSALSTSPCTFASGVNEGALFPVFPQYSSYPRHPYQPPPSSSSAMLSFGDASTSRQTDTEETSPTNFDVYAQHSHDSARRPEDSRVFLLTTEGDKRTRRRRRKSDRAAHTPTNSSASKSGPENLDHEQAPSSADASHPSRYPRTRRVLTLLRQHPRYTLDFPKEPLYASACACLAKYKECPWCKSTSTVPDEFHPEAADNDGEDEEKREESKKQQQQQPVDSATPDEKENKRDTNTQSEREERKGEAEDESRRRFALHQPREGRTCPNNSGAPVYERHEDLASSPPLVFEEKTKKKKKKNNKDVSASCVPPSFSREDNDDAEHPAQNTKKKRGAGGGRRRKSSKKALSSSSSSPSAYAQPTSENHTPTPRKGAPCPDASGDKNTLSTASSSSSTGSFSSSPLLPAQSLDKTKKGPITHSCSRHHRGEVADSPSDGPENQGPEKSSMTGGSPHHDATSPVRVGSQDNLRGKDSTTTPATREGEEVDFSRRSLPLPHLGSSVQTKHEGQQSRRERDHQGWQGRVSTPEKPDDADEDDKNSTNKTFDQEKTRAEAFNKSHGQQPQSPQPPFVDTLLMMLKKKKNDQPDESDRSISPPPPPPPVDSPHGRRAAASSLETDRNCRLTTDTNKSPSETPADSEKKEEGLLAKTDPPAERTEDVSCTAGRKTTATMPSSSSVLQTGTPESDRQTSRTSGHGGRRDEEEDEGDILIREADGMTSTTTMMMMMSYPCTDSGTLSTMEENTKQVRKTLPGTKRGGGEEEEAVEEETEEPNTSRLLNEHMEKDRVAGALGGGGGPPLSYAAAAAKAMLLLPSPPPPPPPIRSKLAVSTPTPQSRISDGPAFKTRSDLPHRDWRRIGQTEGAFPSVASDLRRLHSSNTSLRAHDHDDEDEKKKKEKKTRGATWSTSTTRQSSGCSSIRLTSSPNGIERLEEICTMDVSKASSSPYKSDKKAPVNSLGGNGAEGGRGDEEASAGVGAGLMMPGDDDNEEEEKGRGSGEGGRSLSPCSSSSSSRMFGKELKGGGGGSKKKWRRRRRRGGEPAASGDGGKMVRTNEAVALTKDKQEEEQEEEKKKGRGRGGGEEECVVGEAVRGPTQQAHCPEGREEKTLFQSSLRKRHGTLSDASSPSSSTHAEIPTSTSRTTALTAAPPPCSLPFPHPPPSSSSPLLPSSRSTPIARASTPPSLQATSISSGHQEASSSSASFSSPPSVTRPPRQAASLLSIRPKTTRANTPSSLPLPLPPPPPPPPPATTTTASSSPACLRRERSSQPAREQHLSHHRSSQSTRFYSAKDPRDRHTEGEGCVPTTGGSSTSSQRHRQTPPTVTGVRRPSDFYPPLSPRTGTSDSNASHGYDDQPSCFSIRMSLPKKEGPSSLAFSARDGKNESQGLGGKTFSRRTGEWSKQRGEGEGDGEGRRQGGRRRGDEEREKQEKTNGDDADAGSGGGADRGVGKSSSLLTMPSTAGISSGLLKREGRGGENGGALPPQSRSTPAVASSVISPRQESYSSSSSSSSFSTEVPLCHQSCDTARTGGGKEDSRQSASSPPPALGLPHRKSPTRRRRRKAAATPQPAPPHHTREDKARTTPQSPPFSPSPPPPPPPPPDAVEMTSSTPLADKRTPRHPNPTERTTPASNDVPGVSSPNSPPDRFFHHPPDVGTRPIHKTPLFPSDKSSVGGEGSTRVNESGSVSPASHGSRVCKARTPRVHSHRSEGAEPSQPSPLSIAAQSEETTEHKRASPCPSSPFQANTLTSADPPLPRSTSRSMVASWVTKKSLATATSTSSSSSSSSQRRRFRGGGGGGGSRGSRGGRGISHWTPPPFAYS